MVKKSITIIIVLICVFMVGCGNCKENISSLNENKNIDKINNKDNDSEEKQEDVLKVYSTENNDMIQRTIELFQSKNPDIKLEYIIGDGEKNIDVLNELEKGNGPDIIIPDESLKNAMLECNVLLTMEGKISLSDNIPIFEDWSNKYIIPLRFEVPFLFTKNELYSIEKVIYNVEDFCITEVNFNELVQILYMYYYGSLKDLNQMIDKKLLEQFVNNVIYLAKEKNIIEGTQIKAVQDDDLYMIKKFTLGEDTIMYHFAKSIDDIKYYISATGMERGKADIVQKSAFPSVEIAINRNSKYKSECIKFIEMALSKEIQIVDSQNGFPVNEYVLDNLGKSYVKSDEKIQIGIKKGVEITIGDAEEFEIITMINLIKEVDKIYVKDERLVGILQEEIMKCYKQEKSIIDTIDDIIERYEE